MINLTMGEKLRIARWRTGLDQVDFYLGLCDQQTGSSLERDDHSKMSDRRLAELWRSVAARHDLDVRDVRVWEMARIFRQRAQVTIRDVAHRIGRSHVWVIHAERGQYDSSPLVKHYMDHHKQAIEDGKKITESEK